MINEAKKAIWIHQGSPKPGTPEHDAFKLEMNDWMNFGKPSIGSATYNSIFSSTMRITIETVVEVPRNTRISELHKYVRANNSTIIKVG